MLLVNEMEDKYLRFNRPVLLFFENSEKLTKLKESNEFKRYIDKFQIISEKDSNREKGTKVIKAT